jgi:hypothetical protein
MPALSMIANALKVPREVYVEDALPKNAVGKIAKPVLRERLRAAGAPSWQAESISAALTACGGGHRASKSGSGIRSPRRSKPAPISATAKAPPHQTASGEVASSAPPAAGPRATPAMKVRP